MQKIAVLLILFLSSSFAINLIFPSAKEIHNGDTIDLGVIGPGQTVFLRLDPKITEGGKYGTGGEYDQATPLHLPESWNGKPSNLYGNPLQVEITAPPHAQEGEYTADVFVEDTNNDELPALSFKVKIHVTWDVMDVDVSPSYISVGPGHPAQYQITIRNKGTASDVFEVKSSGLKRWQFKRYVYVPAQSAKIISYELVESEEETYNPTITVVSTASDIIKEERQVGFQVSSDLTSDFKATNHGVIIFPIFENIVYSFMGLVSNLF